MSQPLLFTVTAFKTGKHFLAVLVLWLCMDDNNGPFLCQSTTLVYTEISNNYWMDCLEIGYRYPWCPNLLAFPSAAPWGSHIWFWVKYFDNFWVDSHDMCGAPPHRAAVLFKNLTIKTCFPTFTNIFNQGNSRIIVRTAFMLWPVHCNKTLKSSNSCFKTSFPPREQTVEHWA